MRVAAALTLAAIAALLAVRSTVLGTLEALLATASLVTTLAVRRLLAALMTLVLAAALLLELPTTLRALVTLPLLATVPIRSLRMSLCHVRPLAMSVRPRAARRLRRCACRRCRGCTIFERVPAMQRADRMSSNRHAAMPSP